MQNTLKVNRIKELLEERDLSIKECARKMRVNVTTVSRIVNGKKPVINTLTLCSLAKVLNVSVTEILNEDAGRCIY